MQYTRGIKPRRNRKRGIKVSSPTQPNYQYSCYDIVLYRYDENGNEELNKDGTVKKYTLDNDFIAEQIADCANETDPENIIEKEVSNA